MTSPHNPVDVANNAQVRHDLRKRLLADREALDPQFRQQATERIARQLGAWIAMHAPAARWIALYSPTRGEADLTPWARTQHVLFALPVVAGRGAPLAFAAWQPGEPTVPDAYGIAVPKTMLYVQPDVLVIPCLGFNGERVRLGYGGGYYDRTLAALQPRPLAVGVAFAAQRCNFARAPHDIALNTVITEDGAV